MTIDPNRSRIPKNQYIAVCEAARRLGVSERSVRRWIAQKALASHRFGRTVRISEADLHEFERASRD